MKFTSLKAYLKPGTMFRCEYREYVVEHVEYDSNSNPLLWNGKIRYLDEKSWTSRTFYLEWVPDDGYNELTITKLGGTPLKLEDLI